MPQCKILVISTNPFSYDGISNVIVNYHGKICNSKLQFDIAICQSSTQDRLGLLADIFRQVHILPERKRKLSKYILYLYKIIRKNKYNIIHVHGNSGTMIIEIVVALFAGVKIRIVHSHNSTCNNPMLHKLLKPFLNALTTFNFACSKYAGDWLFNEKYLVMNNGINTEKFSFSQKFRDMHRNALSLNGKIVIGHVGHFSYQKNHDFLIQVFKELYDYQSNFHLLLIGSGPTLDSIKLNISKSEFKYSVTILEKRNDVNELLSAMDIFVLPSRFEGLPLSGVEAQAAGLPSYVSDKISSELNLTDTVTFLSITDTKPWVDHITSCQSTKRENISTQNVSILKQKGFDIDSNAKILTEKYLLMGGNDV